MFHSCSTPLTYFNMIIPDLPYIVMFQGLPSLHSPTYFHPLDKVSVP